VVRLIGIMKEKNNIQRRIQKNHQNQCIPQK